MAEEKWIFEGKPLTGLFAKERVFKADIDRPSQKIIDGFLQVPDVTGAVSDALDDLGIWATVPASILKPILEGATVVGPAMTMRNVPLPIPYEQQHPKRPFRKGIIGEFDLQSLAEPGDVLVYDGGGRNDWSCRGGLAARIAVRKGIAGCVIDGATRDMAEQRELRFPVWSRGITPITGTRRYENMAINSTIKCAGVLVRPGDLVVADDSGVCFVPQEKIEEVFKKIMGTKEKEDKKRKEIDSGIPPLELGRKWYG